MKGTFKRISRRFFIIATIIAVLLFGLACLAAYINPGKHWYVGMLGVLFIFFLALLLIFSFGWFLARSRWAWLPLIAIIAGWGQVRAVFGMHPFTSFSAQQPEGAIRVMQWNVSRWDEMKKRKRTDTTYRLRMFDYIQKMDPDILCFQEFFESKDIRFFPSNVGYITNKLNYPYHYFAIDMNWWKGNFQHGAAIFSRFPIIDSARLRYDSPYPGKKGESLIRVTIDINGRKINVFTTHLQSFHFNGDDYNNISILKNPEDNKDKVLEAGKGIIYRFRNAYQRRYKQADTIRKELDKSRYPTIITGDFNDVPNSYTYNTIRNDMQDAFVKKGFGLGRTFFFISPTLRIDYILAGKEFEIRQYNRDPLPYSDHYPVVADLQLK
ncbi:MAG TPA: endonuclease/exonuclease/phosphatase family protein [Chitinophagaceae bacterium]|nr:endonuclease/exonuclease/phosphatase family protein [Chitinophagaceae bacterium]